MLSLQKARYMERSAYVRRSRKMLTASGLESGSVYTTNGSSLRLGRSWWERASQSAELISEMKRRRKEEKALKPNSLKNFPLATNIMSMKCLVYYHDF